MESRRVRYDLFRSSPTVSQDESRVKSMHSVCYLARSMVILAQARSAIIISRRDLARMVRVRHRQALGQTHTQADANVVMARTGKRTARISNTSRDWSHKMGIKSSFALPLQLKRNYCLVSRLCQCHLGFIGETCPAAFQRLAF